MKFYNTLTRVKEEFIPLNSNKIKIYSCGPTVYNYIHIGNARPICVFDVLRRYFKFLNYNVAFVQNFTDIDDKIINKAIAEKTVWQNITKKFIEEYEIDAAGLNILKPEFQPKVTENIDEIIKIINILIEKNFAYVTLNGDVYFKTKKFKNYGKLSRQNLEDLLVNARIENDENKENPLDFALWKNSKINEPKWSSPWGDGRPGWHIECSAMANRFLGQRIDIHCGGEDLIFPHHENEIAQSECYSGQKFANYWLHNGYINIENKKMSKSLNNFFTVREISEKFGYEPIRYLMISSHYRSPINFSEKILMQCQSALERLYKCRENLEFSAENLSENCGKNNNNEFENKNFIILDEYKKNFLAALDNDLNTADALGIFFDFVKNINIVIEKISKKDDILKIIKQFDEFANILGILYNKKEKINDSEIEEMINLRQKAREKKDWVTADKIRCELESNNIILEDTKNGVKWRVI